MIRAAYAVRERWSKDTWRVLDDLDTRAGSLSRTHAEGLRTLEHDLDQLVTALTALAGFGMESMIREQGWLLLDTGRRIERALRFIDLFLSLLVQRHDGDYVLEHLVLEAVLGTTENFIAYPTHRLPHRLRESIRRARRPKRSASETARAQPFLFYINSHMPLLTNGPDLMTVSGSFPGHHALRLACACAPAAGQCRPLGRRPAGSSRGLCRWAPGTRGRAMRSPLNRKPTFFLRPKWI